MDASNKPLLVASMVRGTSVHQFVQAIKLGGSSAWLLFSQHLPSTLLPPTVSHHVLLVQVPFSPSEPLLPRHPNPMVPVLPVCCCFKKILEKWNLKDVWGGLCGIVD